MRFQLAGPRQKRETTYPETSISRRSKRRARFTVAALESLEARQLLAGDVALVDPLPPDFEYGSVQGRKWEDTNRNGQYDGGELGLGGVRIYADLNGNQQLDRSEPWTITDRDIPETDFDEGGLYTLENIPPGEWMIREVVPNGYEQTYPGPWRLPPIGVAPDPDAFAVVEPPAYEGPLYPGESFDVVTNFVVNPVCIQPVTVDVMSSDDRVHVENLSGTQRNGCGGDVTTFNLLVTAEQPIPWFELVYFDPETGSEHARAPVFNSVGWGDDGGHWVSIQQGSAHEGIDFGNVRVAGGAIEGRKWLDRDGDGQPGEDEPGLGGVTIYADLNNNGRFERGEPSVVTANDDPTTDFDEGGWYQIGGLRQGTYTIREVVPRNYVQTFPGIGAGIRSSETSTMNAGIAIDLEVTDVAVTASDAAIPNNLTAQLDLTVVWPDSCGTIIDSATSYTVVGDNIIVELSGQQEGEFCAEVISPQTVTLEVEGLTRGRYEVIGVLHEFLGDASDDIPTLATAASIELGGAGFHVVDLAANETVSGIDFGNQSTVRPGSIAGTKWLDENGNGVREDNESGLGGVTIYLDTNFNGQLDRGEPQTITADATDAASEREIGSFRFDDLLPGTYIVRELVPRGYIQTFPPEIAVDFLLPIDPDRPETWPDGSWFGGPWPDPDVDPFPGIRWGAEGRLHFVALESGDAVTDINFGNQVAQPGAIEGTKWFDDNGNSQRDEDEPGLAGVTIYVDLNRNGNWDEDEPFAVTIEDDPATADVDETGRYRIEGVEPGRYLLSEVVPDGYVQTYPREWLPFFDVVGFLPPDSPLQLATDHVVQVPSGGTVSGFDFGNDLIEPSSVSGTKWLDENGNGLRDEGELPLAGVTIYADLNFNGQWDEDEPSAETRTDDADTAADETGTYTLAGLEAGFYVIREVVPEGYEQTFPGQFWGPPPVPRPEPFPVFDDVVFADLLDRFLPFIDGAGGHLVMLGQGQDVTDIDFGNRVAPEPGGVDGVVWNDLDGDGQRDPDEPGLADVFVYSDLNGNQRLDRGEPSTMTMRDDPDTDFDEAGLYVLSGLRPGSHTIRQDIRFGAIQTFPQAEGGILDQAVEIAGEGQAMSIRLTDAQLDPDASGQIGAVLTFEVVWPNGCGTLLPERTEAAGGPGMIDVHLFGTQVGDICTLAIETETIDVFVPGINTGRHELLVTFLESAAPGEPENPHFFLKALIGFGGIASGHQVVIEAGGSVSEVNFGQQRRGGVPDPDWFNADMDRDGQLTAADINALASALRAGEALPPSHDLSGDGHTNHADYEYLVLNMMGLPFGDSNMDGHFDSADFVQVFQHGQYEDQIAGNSHWETGDWNGDGEFNSSDLVFAFQHGGYESARSASASTAAAVDAVLALMADEWKPRR